MDYSPALSISSDMTDEELDKYFATYVPLSNLPTPPPAKDNLPPTPSSAPSPRPFLPTTEILSPELQAQASHLANLVPANTSTSTHRPHGDVIRGFLERANLPDEVVAYAACVLDALGARFAVSWREELAPVEYERELKNFLKTDSQQRARVSQDVIVLAALALAHGYCFDRNRSSRHWSVKESAGAFSVREIEATKRAILRDIDYGLFRISDDDVIRMMLEIQRSKMETSLAREGSSLAKQRGRALSIGLAGTAMWSQGLQTPLPSP